jgi:hypothetical protein
MTALIALSLAASAAPMRTLDGQRIETADYVTVSWSMSDPDSLDTLRAASGCPGVLAVSVDPPQVRSQLTPFLRAHGITLPVIADPGAALTVDLSAALPSAPDRLAALLPCLCGSALAQSGQLNVCDPQADLGGR